MQVVEKYAEEPDPPGSLEFLEATSVIMEENNIHFPHTVAQALDVYVTLVCIIERHM